ncbi:hypothetical protein Tco_1269506 [Tanacetum coccineum]
MEGEKGKKVRKKVKEVGAAAKKALAEDRSYHLDLCKNMIGEGVYLVVEATNLYYGGADITNLLTFPK